MVGMNLMFIGTRWIADGKIPGVAGLWWLTLPLLGLALWMYFRDGKLSRPRRTA
jgi:lipopolysaccharide export system permease protein